MHNDEGSSRSGRSNPLHNKDVLGYAISDVQFQTLRVKRTALDEFRSWLLTINGKYPLHDIDARANLSTADK